LFVRGALNVRTAEPGFSLDRTIVATLDPSLAGMDEARTRAVYLRLMERIRALPGVKAASLTSMVPFGDYSEGRRLRRVGDEPGSGAATDGGDASYGVSSSAPGDNAAGIGASYYIIGRDYFETLGIPILRGRGFTEGEEQGSSGPAVAVIDEPLARKLFKSADPLGQHVYIPSKDASEARPFEIVGVVGGTRHSLFDHEPVAHVFMPFGQRFRSGMNLEIHTTAGGSQQDAAMIAAVRKAIRAVDEGLPIIALMTMQQHRDTGMASWIVRMSANLFSLFGGLAALLAVVGVYGVRAYLVSRRTREIGIRMALGATSSDVVWMVLREGLVLVGAGVALGVLLAAGVGSLVASLLYEVSAFDPLVFAAATILLASAALVACYVPARRATRVAPVTALRME
jgi:predicted permease